MKRAPPMGDVSHCTSPPCRWAVARTTANPRPTPPVSRDRDESVRVNRSKIRCRSSSATPVAVVVDGQRDRRRRRSSARRSTDVRRVASGVLDEVADHPRQRLAVADQPGRADVRRYRSRSGVWRRWPRPPPARPRPGRSPPTEVPPRRPWRDPSGRRRCGPGASLRP